MSTEPTSGDAASPHAVERRKEEHVEDAQADVEARGAARWADVHLPHCAIPEVDFDDIRVDTVLLGRRVDAPIMIAALTGGYTMAEELNARLARVAQLRNVPMGVGSQRAALENPALASTYAITRREAPTAFLAANIGAAQLVPQGGAAPLTYDQIDAAIDMIEADALVVHLNFLEEIVQPEGDRCAAGCVDAIGRLVEHLEGRVPVIAKETGAGMSTGAAARLLDVGVAALDVGGQGGTSFAAVEARRAARAGDSARVGLGTTFREWGIPTAVSVAAVAPLGAPVIATGGVRSGLDIAKAIAVGATAAGLARPMLLAAIAGEDALLAFVDTLVRELRTAMFLTGHGSVEELRDSRPVVLRDTAEWLRALDGGTSTR